ncbi:MAG: hypothetical protein IJK91_07955 [Bacteroidales bacterium]|nr:hypothetical protein [Bacteroidales bacterium]
MNRVFKCVLAAFLLLPAIGFASGTEPSAPRLELQGTTSWEELLDSYELICRKCINLKQRQDAGEKIPSGQLLSLMNQLESLRGELKQISNKMPAAAKKRFYAIRQMYLTGVVADTRPELLPDAGKTFLSFCAVNGHTDPLKDAFPLPVAPRPLPSVRAISASVSAPAMSYGVRFDYWGRRFSAWASVRSNFSYHNTSYNALSNGSFNGGRIWASGKAATDRLFATAGPLVRVGKKTAVFGGAGYGFSRLCWEDNNGEWMLVKDLSRSGVCFELGAALIVGCSALSASWLTLPGAVNTANISIGFCF